MTELSVVVDGGGNEKEASLAGYLGVAVNRECFLTDYAGKCAYGNSCCPGVKSCEYMWAVLGWQGSRDHAPKPI